MVHDAQQRRGEISHVTALSATDLAQALNAGDFTAREVTEMHIRRIEAVNPQLNALVWPQFAEARAAAAAADVARAHGRSLGPLHGVPMTIKEQFFVAGTPTTFGIATRKDHRAAADGPIVARLRRAGAIFLGKGNVPQALMYAEADNDLYGQTNNPWDLRRSPGGGTGGDAALVAAGGVPLALAADFTASIRVPGHCCGIHGLKPTSYRLTLHDSPPELFFPGNESINMQPGPLARTVADLDLMLRVMTDTGTANGSDPQDPFVPPVPWPDYRDVSLAGLRVAMYDDDGFISCSPAIRRAVREAAAALQRRGAIVESFTPPDVPRMVGLVFSLLGADGGSWLRRVLAGNKQDRRIKSVLQAGSIPNRLRPVVAAILERSGQERHAGTVRNLENLSADGYFALITQRNEYRDTFMAALDRGRYDAIICPPYPIPALHHGDSYSLFFAFSYCVLYNLLGLPAGVVATTRVRPGEESDRPDSRDTVERTARAVEEGSAGMPIGVQVVARHWREDVALAVMAAIEREARWEPDYPAHPPL